MITHIIHYILADNDLDISAIKDISKLISDKRCVLDILVLVKTSALFLHIDKHVHIKEIKMEDHSDFYSLSFLKKLVARYNLVEKNIGKTEKILMFSGHGSGWFLHGGTASFGDKQIVHMNDIRKALELNNIMIDIICFDCCFSAGTEIIYELMDRVKFIIASQEYMYWEGICSSKLCELTKSLWQKSQKIADDFMHRSTNTQESSTITIIDVEKFRPLLMQLLETLAPEDFRAENIVDTCEIWMKDCPKCDPRECNIFYDLFSTALIHGVDDEFKKRYRESVQFQKNKYFEPKLNTSGINISPAFLDVRLIKKPLYAKTYRKLRIFLDSPRKT
jgi:hypothetical protein